MIAFGFIVIIALLVVIGIQLQEVIAYLNGVKYVIEREAKRIINDNKENIK